jgi:hypothetical protein
LTRGLFWEKGYAAQLADAGVVRLNRSIGARLLDAGIPQPGDVAAFVSTVMEGPVILRRPAE